MFCVVGCMFVICIVWEEMELEVLSLIMSDINNLPVHINEYMEDRLFWGDL